MYEAPVWVFRIFTRGTDRRNGSVDKAIEFGVVGLASLDFGRVVEFFFCRNYGTKVLEHGRMTQIIGCGCFVLHSVILVKFCYLICHCSNTEQTSHSSHFQTL